MCDGQVEGNRRGLDLVVGSRLVSGMCGLLLRELVEGNNYVQVECVVFCSVAENQKKMQTQSNTT